MLVAVTNVNNMLFMFACRLRYGHGCVRNISELKSYEVQFEDGTICSDMSREDIIVSCAGKALCSRYYYCCVLVHVDYCMCVLHKCSERERERERESIFHF